jgi:hypothetical protein
VVLPRLAALDAVVVPIALGDLFLLMPLLALGPPPVRSRLIALEDCLLRERRLRGHEMGALQLKEVRAKGVNNYKEVLQKIQTKRIH